MKQEIIDRDKYIIECRKNHMKYSEIAKKLGITLERVRQVVAQNGCSNYCSYHNHRYDKKCRFCRREDAYLKKLINFPELLQENWFRNEVLRLSVESRKKELVVERGVFIRKLHDDYFLTISEISKLMGFTTSNIIHYLKKHGKSTGERQESNGLTCETV